MLHSFTSLYISILSNGQIPQIDRRKGEGDYAESAVVEDECECN